MYKRQTEGWLFRAQYDYDGRYFVSASFRRDASSCFHPDNRWGNFWSVGAGDVYKRQEVKFMIHYTLVLWKLCMQAIHGTNML